MQGLEDSDTYISLARAAELSGLSPATLRSQALGRHNRRSKLLTQKLNGKAIVTTRRWLHEYLMNRSYLDFIQLSWRG